MNLFLFSKLRTTVFSQKKNTILQFYKINFNNYDPVILFKTTKFPNFNFFIKINFFGLFFDFGFFTRRTRTRTKCTSARSFYSFIFIFKFNFYFFIFIFLSFLFGLLSMSNLPSVSRAIQSILIRENDSDFLKSTLFQFFVFLQHSQC